MWGSPAPGGTRVSKVLSGVGGGGEGAQQGRQTEAVPAQIQNREAVLCFIQSEFSSKGKGCLTSMNWYKPILKELHTVYGLLKHLEKLCWDASCRAMLVLVP